MIYSTSERKILNELSVIYPTYPERDEELSEFFWINKKNYSIEVINPGSSEKIASLMFRASSNPCKHSNTIDVYMNGILLSRFNLSQELEVDFNELIQIRANTVNKIDFRVLDFKSCKVPGDVRNLITRIDRFKVIQNET